MQSITAVAPVILAESRRPPILPIALIACGLALTVAWIGLIGRGIVALIGLAL
jgi:hypothetical protein